VDRRDLAVLARERGVAGSGAEPERARDRAGPDDLDAAGDRVA
jgi:hypothetical protein